MRAIIIEDDGTVNAAMTRMLTSSGWSVASAANAYDALRLFEAGRFDVAIAAIDLKFFDGLALAQRMRRLDPRVRIIMMAGDPTQAQRPEVAALGPFLQKPFTLDELRRAVDAASAVNVFEAINQTLQEYYVGVTSLSPVELTASVQKPPSTKLSHWEAGHKIEYRPLEQGLRNAEAAVFIANYAVAIAREGWRVITE